MKFNAIITEDGMSINISDNKTSLTQRNNLNNVTDLIKIDKNNNRNLYNYVKQPIKLSFNLTNDSYQLI